MRQFLWIILWLLLATAAGAQSIPYVCNNTESPTKEDSLRIRIWNLEDTSLASVGLLDTVHVKVEDVQGTVIFTATFNVINGFTDPRIQRMSVTATGGKFDSAYFFVDQVSNIDGTSPTPGIYTIIFRAAGHGYSTDNYRTFTMSQQFYLLPYRMSALSPIADSLRTRWAVYKLLLDSTARAGQIMDSIIERFQAAEDTLYDNKYYTRVENTILNAQASIHQLEGTVGLLLSYLNPGNYATITELMTAFFQSTADTTTNSNLAKIIRWGNEAHAASLLLEQMSWVQSSRIDAFYTPSRGVDVDSLFYGQIISLSPDIKDTMGVIIYLHPGGSEGKPPDNHTPVKVIGW